MATCGIPVCAWMFGGCCLLLGIREGWGRLGNGKERHVRNVQERKLICDRKSDERMEHVGGSTSRDQVLHSET